MKIKSLTIGALLGVSIVLGSVSASAAPVDTNSVSPFADQNLVLRVGEIHNFSGTISMVDNIQNVIAVTYPSTIRGIKPGQAKLRVYSNGVYTYYDIFVKSGT
ncbi:hypothetical protein [Paenibacillus sp. ISL-20]|uniref:hypothetical protein n=1 Tax=Paenibacillus sp. ISL-20 TaxID=2819163 RepID=UPI001BE874FE|nr:hypothetical protein [Paenibacillus sp. ISL-20]MBT2759923.1 hypothetical protein [Paenibacillus sp. ISL-20]